ncbi:hypothetical protein H0A36_10450 [Endozoicomonas sp. SM1973]|uniref:PEP-CTERM sorting domain-containing protein n=1 Tax=Spartinivicinus marinus TaxID=2994442 RepID=A0A853I1D1_9GAMM|nr:hypothetical protein [Spartinivicinus marinus]MCX4027395.1 hypothetical protein [Spartinivicinus marinus]NYZ66429.1 hypothetical protein [Spartinivicinus marinus]
MNNWLKRVAFASGLLCSATVLASPINITNGGFETGQGNDISGWFHEIGHQVAYTTNQLTHNGTRYTAAEGNRFAVLPANASIRAETNWKAGDTISFKWLALEAINPTFQLFENGLIVTKSIDLVGSTGTWHEFSYTFVSAVGQNNLPSFISFQGFADDADLDQSLLVDDVKITRIPVPATFGLAMLGLGYLVARQRLSSSK